MPQDEFLKNYAPLIKKLKEEYAKSGDISDLLPNGYNHPSSEADTSWLPWDKTKGGYWEGGRHWSEVLGDDAVGFINQAKEKDTPFFMYLAFNAPHDPRQSPKEFVDMYPLDNISVPESFLPEYPFKDDIGCSPILRDEALAPFPRTEYSIKVNRQEYYAIITHMDYQIGRILEALEASGKSENTYIFFTADHGLAVGNHGFTGKQNMYDHSIRPPLLVAGPDIPSGKRISAAVYLQDIMASSLELAGAPKPDYVRFNSFMPLIREERKESFYPAVYGCYTKEQRMIRNDNFKLILYPKIEVLRLYDMKNDPLELDDLSNNPEFKTMVTNLLKEFKKMQIEYNDSLDLTQFYKDYQLL
jgi:arylsulfatase A-like enzyme